MPTLAERFMHNVVKDNITGCWNWSGYRDRDGYGEFRMGMNKFCKFRAHRLSHELFIGPIPDKEDVHHKCRNKSCVNPEHLQAVNKRVHVLELTPDSPAAKNSQKTHCIHGHLFDTANTMVSLDGRHRRCRACALVKSRDWKRTNEPISKRQYCPDPTVTHCPKGHKYTPENTQLTGTGRRCRRCHADRENAKFHRIHPNSPYEKERAWRKETP
jgi:hypothetical protein